MSKQQIEYSISHQQNGINELMEGIPAKSFIDFQVNPRPLPKSPGKDYCCC